MLFALINGFDLISGQMWLLKGTELTNKANHWQSKDEWNLESVGTSVYIKNISNNTVLATAEDDIVIEEDLKQNDMKQMWKKGTADYEGYFAIKNYHSQKVMAAIPAAVYSGRTIQKIVSKGLPIL